MAFYCNHAPGTVTDRTLAAYNDKTDGQTALTILMMVTANRGTYN
jgi:hypothetical protein